MKISRKSLRWIEYVPDLGDNRDHETPLVLEVCTGLTRAELTDWATRVEAFGRETVQIAREAQRSGKAAAEIRDLGATRLQALGAILGEYLRIKGQHTFEGKPLETIAQYIEITAELADPNPKSELLQLVTRLNTLAEDDALFSERLSGGLGFTPRRSAANKTNPMGRR